MKRREYDDDDGRAVADMSGVERPRVLFPGGRGQARAVPQPELSGGEKADRPWEQEETFTRAERRWYVLGALKAALLIAFAFLTGIGLFIALLLRMWI